MSSFPNRAQPALEFVPPAYSPLLRSVMSLMMPGWTSLQTEVAEIESHNVETLAKIYNEFRSAKARVLIAFRHPSPIDPYVMSHLLWRALPQTARRMGLRLGKTHSHFIYDRGIPLWAGGYVSWIFSRLGGVPIQRGKLDLLALRTARELFLNGEFPLAAAPEGGNNGHNEIISPLEPGIAQLAFWCVEDLLAARRDESVVIVPVGIQYQYLEDPWTQLEALIAELELESGIGAPNTATSLSLRQMFGSSADNCREEDVPVLCDRTDLYGRLYRLAEHLLSLMEGYYQEFYGIVLEANHESEESANAVLGHRLHTLMDEALRVTEKYFSVRPKGSVIDRCRKLEQAGWDRIFRENTLNLSAVELGLANRVAEEANLRLWHMRLVESFVAVTGCYVKENPTADRFAETTLLLRDMTLKIKRQPETRPRLGKQKAIVTVGEPIDVGSRLTDYRQKRRKAISQLTEDLQTKMESLIISS
ncbi:MAG: 1-acyl-sn-glycerol-3-phosphate acyltransferase [Cyanobacteria bacterium P01_D01_bin.105]